MAAETVHISYKGSLHTFEVDVKQTSLTQFATAVSRKTGVALATIKFALPGDKLVKYGENPTSSLSAAGIRAGAKLLLLGSRQGDVEAVRASKDLPGLAGFDHELRVLAARRRVSSADTARLPTGPHTFQDFQAWEHPGLQPPPSEAMKLLHKLAADSGITGVMKKHGWSVGKLSEMPPEGKVGVSPVCILGVNINAGQEISLRLRTDDLKGFRRYLSIRDTLCHELAHMVFGEHDLNFKRLNSQLRRECEDMSRTSGTRLAEAAEGWHLEVPLDPANVMAATATSSGKTLRELKEHGAMPPLRPALALQEQPELNAIQGSGHRDAETEALEREAEQLGAVPRQGPGADTPDLDIETPAPVLLHRLSSSGEPAQDSPTAGGLPPEPESQPDDPQSWHNRSREGVDERSGLEIGDPLSGGHLQQPAAIGGSDASVEYFGKMQQAVQKLVAELQPQDAALALQTLATILKNALQNPEDAKFRRIRQRNHVFHARAGQHPEALELLRAAGFVAERDGQEDILWLGRNDPGLLWIALTACEAASQAEA